MLLQFCVTLLILGSGMYFSVKAGKLTETGALTGGLLGLAIFLGAGFTGLTMLALFFIIGSGVTGWQLQYKANLGLAEENKGRRTAGQAFANAGVAGILGLLAWLAGSHSELFTVMLAASFASATADTVSSELGNVYGKRFYNILTLKPDTRGLNGVVSLEGTALGALGSLLMAIVYSLGFGWNENLVYILMGGTLGNLTDSVLGATLERQNYLSNNAVNFLNTLVGAIAAGLCYISFY